MLAWARQAVGEAASNFFRPMHCDQAWPEWSDFSPQGGLAEFKLRLFDSLLVALPLVLLAAWASCPDHLSLSGLDRWLGLSGFVLLPAGVLGWLLFPSRFRLGHPVQVQPGAIKVPPQLQRAGNLLSYNQERRDAWALFLVLLLAAATGPVQALALLSVMAPLLAYRMLSRLWTEVDLVSGQVFYHRTWCGLQITRQGPDLDGAAGVVSGALLPRPGEEPRFTVCVVLDQQVVPVNTQCASRTASHEAGQKLALQLDLPHLPLDHDVGMNGLCGSSFRGDSDWKPLRATSLQAGDRSKLPPGGDDQ